MAKKNEIAIIGAELQPLNALEMLKEKLNSLKAITDQPYKSSGTVNIGGTSINIQTETKLDNLIKVWSAVKNKAKAYNEAALDLGIDSYPTYSESGQSPEHIKEDIKLRISVITFEEQRKELEALIKEGEQFLTKEDQFTAYKAKLAKLAGK